MKTPVAQAAMVEMASATMERDRSRTTPPGTRHPLPQEAEAASYMILNYDDGQYAGTVRGGQPDGLGTCTYKDGNQYDGEWRAGRMHGFGTFLWGTGERFVGEWKNGERNGVGVKHNGDGSTFEGFWRSGRKHGVGVYRPPKVEKKAATHNKSASSLTAASDPAGSIIKPGVPMHSSLSPSKLTADQSRVSPRPSHITPAGDAQVQAGDSVTSAPPHEAVGVAVSEPRSSVPLALQPSVATSATTTTTAAAAAAGADGLQDAAISTRGSELSAPGHLGATGEVALSEEEQAGTGGSLTYKPSLAAKSEPEETEHTLDTDVHTGPQASTNIGLNIHPAMSVSVVPEPAAQVTGPSKSVVFIRRYDEGRLEHEFMLTEEDVKLIFKGVAGAKTSAKRSKTVKRVKQTVKRALGMGRPKLQQKAGELIYKGMPGYDLMIRLQLGIRQSVGRMAQPSLEGRDSGPDPASGRFRTSPANPAALLAAAGLPITLEESDFEYKAKVFFPSCGSSNTPAHPSSDFKWKDYSPKVFHALRMLWGVHDAEYMLSLAGSQALRQLNSPGKSGCMFFLSDDQKFLVKTMRKSEIHTLISMLPKYYKHWKSNPDALIPRFYGVYGVKEVHGRTVRFVVMSNIFCTDLQIHRKFDLKGSTFARTIGKPVDSADSKTVWKDLDLNLTVQLPKEQHDRIHQQLAADVHFLEECDVMDYSLLLGIHFCSRVKQASFPAGYGSMVYTGRWTAADIEHGLPDGLQSPTEPYKRSYSTPMAMPSSPFERATPFAGAAVEAGAATGVDAPPPVNPTLNFDLYSNKEDLSHQLEAVKGRMKDLKYDEERIQDVLELAKLKFLGDKLMVKTKKGGYSQSLSLSAVRAHAQTYAPSPRPGGANVLSQIPEFREDDTEGLNSALLDSPKHKKPPGLQLPHLPDQPGPSILISPQASPAPSPPGPLPPALDTPTAQVGPGPLQPLPLLQDIPLIGAQKQVVGTQNGGAGGMVLTRPSGVPAVYPSMVVPMTGSDNESVSDSEHSLSDGEDTPRALMPMLKDSAGKVPFGLNMMARAVKKSHPPGVKAKPTKHRKKSLLSNFVCGAHPDDEAAAPDDVLPAQQVGGIELDPDADQTEVWVCLGIIDILQDYNTRKVFERGIKKTLHDGYAISVAPPGLYASRFLEFMKTEVLPVPMPDHVSSMARWNHSFLEVGTMRRNSPAAAVLLGEGGPSMDLRLPNRRSTGGIAQGAKSNLGVEAEAVA